MTVNWRYAFDGSGSSISPDNRQRVLHAIADWNSDWDVSHDAMWITRIEDEDGDTVWDCDHYGYDDIDNCFPQRFLEWMDQHFKLNKKSVVIGKATILPIPDARP